MQRFDRNGDTMENNVKKNEIISELRQLYRSLYGDNVQAWLDLENILEQADSGRPEMLKRLDEERLRRLDWFKERDRLGMQLYVQSFAGTLRGVLEKLDYIESCGVNYLHLMPLLESPEGRSDGGYAVSDFRKVQQSLGTMEDLSALTEECHRRGISVCLDFVMNHTSEDHEWARRARAGEKEYQDRYFFYDDWSIPQEFEKTVPQVFPTTAPGNFTWCEEAHKVVMTTFYPYQWDLDYGNPDVFNAMTDNMLFLYIWKELGTNCRNLPQVHTLVRMMRLVCEVVCPGTLLLGEVVMEPSRVVPYFGSIEKPECHMLYNVTTMASIWHTVATKDVRLLRHQLGQVFALPKEYAFLNYIRCHDDIGWGLDYAFLSRFEIAEVPHKKYLNDYLTGKWPGSPSRGELYNDDPRLGDARLCGTTASLCGVETARKTADEAMLTWALRVDLALHALVLTMSGLPILYSGDELAQENDYGYHDDPLKAADSRYLHRGSLNWEAAARAEEDGTIEHKLFHALRTLENLRLEHRVFDSRADTWIVSTGDDRVLGIGRYYEGEKLIALFNFGESGLSVSIDELGSFTDLATGEACDNGNLLLFPGEHRWLICEF